MRLVLSVAAALALAPSAAAQAPEQAPRRLFFVHAGGYLYANRLTSSAPGGPDRTRDAAKRLATALRVPTAKGNDQLFVLADTAATDPHPPTKATIIRTLDSFCATTREQDRAVIYFGAHAVEKDGKAFLVPLDGELDAPDTLIPVADLYAKLDKLKAAQKVVIWDVGRHNPDRIGGRRDGGPMTEELFKSLTTPPQGIQVLVSCSPGERGLEYTAPRGPAALFAGSAYLDALRQSAADGFANTAPGDPIPAEVWVTSAAKMLTAVAKQTPVAAGTAPKNPAPFDTKAAPAKRFELPEPPKAPAVEAKAVFDELALPPLFEDDPAQVGALSFAADTLKSYAPDVSVDEVLKSAEKYPLRVATLRALQTVRDVWPHEKEVKGITPLSVPVTEKIKKTVSNAQEPLAEALLTLEAELERLQAVSAPREKEPKRWQAHYDFAVAELRLRLVVLNERNLLLARVRTETLPDLAAGSPGWRLVGTVKIQSRREVKELFTASQEGFDKLAADHKGTPWAVLAKRSRAALPGLRWEPLPVTKGTER